MIAEKSPFHSLTPRRVGRYLLFSDIPNNRMLRWLEDTGEVSVFRNPSNYSNGNFRDRQGRLLTSLINQLDLSPDAGGWPEGFASRFLELSPAELDVLKEWLLQVCEYVPYRRWGIAASGPGDTFGRAFDAVDLLQREAERRRVGSA